MPAYPEKIPTTAKAPIDSFYFRLDAAKDIKKQLESQVAHLDERIEKIVDHFTLADMPIIRFILNVSEDREDLKKVAKALDRVADLIDARNEILPKLQLITTAEKNPNWLAMAFGDFSNDVELEIDNIINGEYND
jgi:predicted  nucleic acid-binding Zn-ribbon protein